MKFIKSIPMAICGLSLAFAALGNLLLPYGVHFRYISGLLSVFVLVIFGLKILLDSSHAKAELRTPVPLSVLPTATMAMMLLCTYIQPYVQIAVNLWRLSIVAHVIIIVLFFKKFIIGFKITNVYPTWFIPFVGIATISVTAPIMDAYLIGQVAFYIGFVFYFMILALVIYRMTKPIFVLEPLRLTTAIFTAPMSLLLVGYFSSFQERNTVLVYFMLTIAIISYIYVTVKMLTTFLKIKFYPTYAAYTFPYVISALAFRLGSNFLSANGHTFLTPLVTISEWIAIGIVIYVSIHYIRFFRYILKF